MSTTSRKRITQVKLELKEVVENLNTLQNLQPSDEQQLKHFKQKTAQLLKNLEQSSLETLKTKLSKQQKRRQKKKVQKRKHLEKQTIIKTQAEASDESQLQNIIAVTSQIKPKPIESSRHYHHHLKSLHECQRFLKTFELLEQLHLARGQDPAKTRSFSRQLQHLKLIWNSMLQEQQSEQSNNEQQTEQQWNHVLFGMTEKCYFEDKPNLNYFLRKRQIWDSYIDKTHGTSIPIGWVTPPLKPNDEWSKYLAK